MNVRQLTALLSFLSLATLASAHFVWVERTSDGPAAFFGEWSDNLRENQEGYLKLIAGPKALASDGSALPVTVKHDKLVIAGAPAGDVRLSAHYRPEKGDTFVRYYARNGCSDTGAARLDYELVPTAAGGSTFMVMLKGKPLADAEVVLFSSTGWSRKFKSGADGRVTVQTPWKGEYLLETSHVEKAAGEHEGRAHQQVRHVSTILFASGR